MVWGAVWIGERSELQVMERDEDTPKNSYSARSYIKILEEGLLPYYTPRRFFLQDNARIHIAKVTKCGWNRIESGLLNTLHTALISTKLSIFGRP